VCFNHSSGVKKTSKDDTKDDTEENSWMSKQARKQILKVIIEQGFIINDSLELFSQVTILSDWDDHNREVNQEWE
jgi:hypothetical protein